MEDNPLIRQSSAEQRSLWLVKFCRTSPENVARLESQIARGENLVAKGFVFECEDMELALCKFFSARDDLASGKPDPLVKELFFFFFDNCQAATKPAQIHDGTRSHRHL